MYCHRLSRDQSNKLYLDVLEAKDEAAMRKLALSDLFFLLTVVFRRTDINRQWLYDRCREVEQAPNGYLDLWAREHYKDLACDTPVLTDKGWATHGELRPGDKVLTPSGFSEVIAVKHFSDSVCRRISFRGGASIIAGAGHIWRVKAWDSKRIKGDIRTGWVSKYMRTDDLLADSYKKPKIVIDAVRGLRKQLPLDPYMLGVWLGDGDARGGRICGQDEGVFDELKYRGFRLSKSHCPKRAPFKTVTVYGLVHSLRSLGVLGKKHVPYQYLIASEKDRLALLQGLMDTDGHQSKGRNSHAIFSNTNYSLIESVCALACSLGFKARISPARTTGSWHVAFQTSKRDRLCPFLLDRKASARSERKRNDASRHWYVQDVAHAPTVSTNCIQIANSDGIYLAGKQLIPTHNSTIITYGKTIQDILTNPDITVGIFSHTRPIAKAFLAQIKHEFEANTFLKGLFPDVLYPKPERDSPGWSIDNGIIVKRKTNPKEATVEAWGLVDGQPTSKHFRLMVYDDVVTKESVSTPEQIAKTTEALALSSNLGASGGHKRYIGTRYHYFDTYHEIIERGTVRPRIYPATDSGKIDGRPVFLTGNELQDKLKEQGSYVFSCQMLQDPIADNKQGFSIDWFTTYDNLRNNQGWNYYILVDPSSSKKKTDGDYTVMVVIALAFDGNYYFIEGFRDRLNLTEKANRLISLHRKYYSKARVGYEQYGMQADIEYIKTVMDAENYRFEITPLGGSLSKVDRIKRLIPIHEARRFYYPHRHHFVDTKGKVHDYIDEFKREEYTCFPVMKHDDMLDCHARILDPDLNACFPIEKSEFPATIIPERNMSETDYDVLE